MEMHHTPRVELARDSLAQALAAYREGAQAAATRASGPQSVSAPDRIAHLHDCVRYYAKLLRTEGEQPQPMLKGLMDVVRETIPNDPQAAKVSAELAQWCIDAYYDTGSPEPVGRRRR